MHIFTLFLHFYGNLEIIKSTFKDANYQTANELINLIKNQRAIKSYEFKKELDYLKNELEKIKSYHEEIMCKYIFYILL